MSGPKNYRNIEEFEREELRPMQKIGFSLDDLYEEAHYKAEQETYTDEPEELNFDY